MIRTFEFVLYICKVRQRVDARWIHDWQHGDSFTRPHNQSLNYHSQSPSQPPSLQARTGPAGYREIPGGPVGWWAGITGEPVTSNTTTMI